MMKRRIPPEALIALACDIDERPRSAPTIDGLLPRVTGIARATGALIVDFEPSAAEDVTAFAAAEQVCCGTLGWHVESGVADRVRLRIDASDEQLEWLHRAFTPDAALE